tara:strand:+ start:267 stop:554 length:288 start_codon:yes stop_codon:yes gene_type:complete
MLLTTLTISSLSFTTLFLGYKNLKNAKELKELKLKHKITTTFADKLAQQLLRTEKAAMLHKLIKSKDNSKVQQVEGEVKHKKTRRSKKRVSNKPV